ncbi:hypothetical protein HDU93_000553 [Gonapodya sp. JEL0774]|nr:hypothetical protein HDU93_000553 [Gonapodya sp. JEL0774]
MEAAESWQSNMVLASYNPCAQAFPCISTGIYGYPNLPAAHIALETAREFLEGELGGEISRIIFVIFLDVDWHIYNRIAPLYFPPPPLAEGALQEEGEVTEGGTEEVEAVPVVAEGPGSDGKTRDTSSGSDVGKREGGTKRQRIGGVDDHDAGGGGATLVETQSDGDENGVGAAGSLSATLVDERE